MISSWQKAKLCDQAWKESIDGADKFRFLSDTKGELSKAIDMSFPAEKIFGNDRTKRFVMLVKDNKVKYVSAEPDNTGVSEGECGFVIPTMADKTNKSAQLLPQRVS